MTKLILSTSNVMSGGPSIIRRSSSEKSNVELTTSLRANFLAAQDDSYQESRTNGHSESQTNGSTNGASQSHSLASWTAREDPSTLYIPAIDWSLSGLAEERSQYDITVKLFYLPDIPAERRCVQTREAIELVLKELNMPSIDLLIVSFPGMAFNADEEGDSEKVQISPCGGESGASLNGEYSESSSSSTEAEDMDSIVRTWRSIEKLHSAGTVAKLGVSEFGSKRLRQFLQRTTIPPSVNQINVRDCCVVPKPLIQYARKEGIELLTHNECTNILPRGTVRELLRQGEKGAGVLTSSEGEETSLGKGVTGGLQGDVEPQWVVKYTAVVKDRGVVENKGYFAVAELKD
ncbi:MAG: hypothetical protein M1837_005434 [Sclerophora amabilis]|nr:MAG: hypothetical protein M1837_005434 [Sclerophora amabilis]